MASRPILRQRCAASAARIERCVFGLAGIVADPEALPGTDVASYLEIMKILAEQVADLDANEAKVAIQMLHEEADSAEAVNDWLAGLYREVVILEYGTWHGMLLEKMLAERAGYRATAAQNYAAAAEQLLIEREAILAAEKNVH